MLEKLSTIWWFLQRPSMYIQAWHLMIRRVFFKNDRFGEEKALIWCKQKAKSEKEIISILYPGKEFVQLGEIENEVISKAKLLVEESPFEMGGEAALDLIYNICFYTFAKNVLETGVSYGWSSLSFLLALKNNGGQLYSIDMPYPKMGNEQYVGIVIPEPLRKLWTLYQVPDRIGIPKAIKTSKNNFDIIHYDSDKSYTGRKWAYPVLWKSLINGGVLISETLKITPHLWSFVIQFRKNLSLQKAK